MKARPFLPFFAVLLTICTTAPGYASPRMVLANRGAVAAEHRLASEAGAEILRAGGNAIDAAVAAALASGVVNPASSGLGGGGFLVVYLANDSRAHVVDFREAAPARARGDMYTHSGTVDLQASKRGGLAVAVPGEAAGFALALERFGTMSFAQVAGPAVRLARDGFLVEHHLAATIAENREGVARDKELRRIFLHEDGTPYREGEVLGRPALADSLEILGLEGAAAFYTGSLGKQIVATVKQQGGILDFADLAAYRAVQRPPLLLRYRKWQLITMPPPSSGGGVIGEALAALEAYHLDELGHNSATYIHLVAEILKAVFADRAAYYGDPDFYDVPLLRLLSPAHARALRKGLSAVTPASPSRYGTMVPAGDSGTTHISVIDATGNAAALTTSINTAFGSMIGVPGRGIILNNTMDDFSIQPGVANAYGLLGSQANSIEPGKRPLSSMSPAVVLEDGRLRMVLGASGGPKIITATLQTFLNVVEFHMSVGQAVDAPRFHHQWMPNVLAMENGIPRLVQQSLARMGHTALKLTHAGAVQAVEILRLGEERRLRAVSDWRKGGVPAAE